MAPKTAHAHFPENDSNSENEKKSEPDTGRVVPPASEAPRPEGDNDNYISETWPPEGKRIITEAECDGKLGFDFPTWKKWTILTIIFLVQTSMNFNTSLYSNGVAGISEEFGVSLQAARAGAAIFLVTYAFGCELWAPWSEEIGRKPVLQASLLLVNLFCIPVGVAPNFGTILAFRALGGLATAGGSVTLGMVADMFDSDNQQNPIAYIVFSSVGGSILGPIVGGFVEQFVPEWRWNMWIQLIFGGAVQLAHLFLVPETRTTIMMDKIAKKLRKSGEDPNVYGPNELIPWKDRFSAKEIITTWTRPFKMFLTEPIVLTLSLLSGFSDALIFMMIQSLTLVYHQWDFQIYQVGLAFIPIGIGYVIAWLVYIPNFRRERKKREANPENEQIQYESRLKLLLYLAPCLPLGLLGFAWTSTGPPIHWIGSMVFTCMIGIANYAIYMATIDYMICAYGPYSASATGGNGWARDILAGILTVPATPFFQNIGPENRHITYPCLILFAIAFLLIIAVYVIYWKGPVMRKKSPFAQKLADAAKETGSRRGSNAFGYSSRNQSRTASAAVSRSGSFSGPSPARPGMASREHSHVQRRLQALRTEQQANEKAEV